MELRARARARTAATLAVLAVLLVGGAAWAWSSLTAPFPAAEEPAVCTDRTIPAGERLRPEDLTISVLNASGRAGLASVTMESFAGRGFGVGELANAPDDAEVRRVQIWAADPDSPAVRLVASYLGGNRTEIVVREATEPGINVVLGENFEGVERGRQAIRVRGDDLTVCTPTTPSDETTDGTL